MSVAKSSVWRAQMFMIFGRESWEVSPPNCNPAWPWKYARHERADGGIEYHVWYWREPTGPHQGGAWHSRKIPTSNRGVRAAIDATIESAHPSIARQGKD